MSTAKELWEQNRNDPLTKRLNDVLSKNSGSFEHASGPSASEGSEQQAPTEAEVLYGKNPKSIQTLNDQLKGKSK